MAVDDEHVPLEKYKHNLLDIAKQLQAETPEGKLFWLSSTPVPDVPLAPPRPQGDVAVYNAAAKEVMDSLGVPIVDLYSFVIEQCGGDEKYTACPGFQRQNNVHFEPAGYEAMAKYINSAINSATMSSAIFA